MGKYKAMIPIFLALVIAAGGSLFLYKWLQHQGGPKQVVVKEKAEAVPVAVAAVDLPWGTKLKKEMIKTLPFLKESLPPGYVSAPEKLEGRIIIAQVRKNEPVTESRLAPESVTSGGVSAVLKQGKRAVAVKGDKVIGISGFIKPGDRVDVLMTMTDPRKKHEVTKIVLENVQVLATGTQIQENSEGNPSPVDVYTLEVTPDDAEKLGLAAARGKLQFALRNITDAETVFTRGATVSHALASFRGPGPKPKAASQKKTWRPRKVVTTVEVIKGNKVTKQKFKL